MLRWTVLNKSRNFLAKWWFIVHPPPHSGLLIALPMHIIWDEGRTLVSDGKKQQAGVVNTTAPWSMLQYQVLDDSTFNSSDEWTPMLRGQDPFSLCHFSWQTLMVAMVYKSICELSWTDSQWPTVLCEITHLLSCSVRSTLPIRAE